MLVDTTLVFEDRKKKIRMDLIQVADDSEEEGGKCGRGCGGKSCPSEIMQIDQ